jgi:hypothetical protein
MKLGQFFVKMLSEPGTGEPSSKRVLFTLAIVCTLSFAGGSIWRTSLDATVADLLKFIVGATAGAYGVARFAEKGKDNDGQP